MRALSLCVFSAACAFISQNADASLLVAGSTQLPASAEPGPVGATLIDSSVTPFAALGAFSGVATSQVYSNDASNPLGGLTFVISVTSNGQAGPNSIGRVTVESFAGFLTDVSYTPGGLGVAPATITRDISGDVIGFNFFPSPLDPFTGFLVPGTSTKQLVIQTNATSYTTGTMYIIDGGITSVSTFMPVIPAPGALALLSVAGLVGGASRRRRA